MLGHRLSFVSAPSAQRAPAAPSRGVSGAERATPASSSAAAPSRGTLARPEPAVTAVPLGSTVPSAPTASTTSTVSVVAIAAPAAEGRVPPPPAPAPARETAPRVNGGAPPPPAPVGILQLTAEPAAWVEVDATRVGRTPLMNHASSPGRHTLTFVNPLLGERLEATVTVAPTSFTRVHADFTSANPRVIVR
jgi:hypothetical protein